MGEVPLPVETESGLPSSLSVSHFKGQHRMEGLRRWSDGREMKERKE
jgi:hypothetical protein